MSSESLGNCAEEAKQVKLTPQARLEQGKKDRLEVSSDLLSQLSKDCEGCQTKNAQEPNADISGNEQIYDKDNHKVIMHKNGVRVKRNIGDGVSVVSEQRPDSSYVGFEWNLGARKLPHKFESGLPQELPETKDIVDRLILKYPKQANFINSLFVPWVKVPGEAYIDIYDKLDIALYSIDFNFGPRIVRGKIGEVDRTEIVNFGDSNSTNANVKNLRAIVREMNAKYFTKSQSPFDPALYN